MTYAPGDLVEIIATDHEHYGTRAIVEQIFYGGVYAHVAAIGSVKFNAADLGLVTAAHAIDHTSNAPGSFSNPEPNQYGWYYRSADHRRIVIGGMEYVRRADLDEAEIAPPTQRTPTRIVYDLDGIRIYENSDGVFTAATDQAGWLPGTFDTGSAALAAAVKA